jgi:nitrate/TMAO reductase-like tetraheme cytochrome c subunit
MPKKKVVVVKKFPILPVILTLAVMGLLLTAGGFAFAATQEQHDSFCGSCHTQPESTFLQRSAVAQPVDLASFHTAKKTNCIDCHSGAGVGGRLAAELQGAQNAFHWFTGTAVQPAKLTAPVGDDSCLKCHQNVTSQQGRNNHFHGFMARWQAVDPNAGDCVSCHRGHSTTAGNAQSNFTNRQVTQPVCDACHRAIRRED